MTRTAIYHATPNHIVEQPAMEPPYYYDAWLVCKKINKFLLLTSDQIKPIEEYNAHLSTLRTIPTHESARSLWKDKQKVEEGKDYEVLTTCKLYATPQKIPDHYCMDCRLKAFPLPVKSEDDYWDDLVNVLCPDYYDTEKVDELKQKYTLIKK